MKTEICKRVRHRYADVSNIGPNFKLTITNRLRDPVENMGNMQEQMGNFKGEMKTTGVK